MTSMMPAEWEEHESTWISWPTNASTFGDLLADVEKIFVEMVHALRRGERVDILVPDTRVEERARDLISLSGGLEGVRFHLQASSDVWIRDYGPLFVYDGQGDLAMTKWGYNAYGNKYDDLAKDDEVFSLLAPNLGFEPICPGMVLEGGSIDVNGHGTLLTSEQCLLNRNRNPGMDKRAIAQMLESHLGAKHIVWLCQGLEGDDTDGHVDDIARFVSERTVLSAVEEDRSSPNHGALETNRRILSSSCDQDGEPLEVIPLPMPSPIRAPWGLLPGSYANFYISNRSVLLPVFADHKDQNAQDILSDCLPGRSIVPIDCRALIRGMGAIHCSTMQQPLRRRR